MFLRRYSCFHFFNPKKAEKIMGNNKVATQGHDSAGGLFSFPLTLYLDFLEGSIDLE